MLFKVLLYVDHLFLTGLKQMSLFQPKQAEDGSWARDFLLGFKGHHWTLLTASALEYLIMISCDAP